MIISGGSRSNWRFFSSHLMKTEENEHVRLTEFRGLASEEVREAFREMSALASGTRCKNFFYHANINPRADESLTEEQWEKAIDTLEEKLGLTGHSRFVVEHEKEGRTHRHVVWSRINPDSMTAVSDSNNYAAHERASRALEEAFGHEAVQGAHGRDGQRPDRRTKNWETFRGHGSGIDPQAMKAQLTELWNRADSGKAFAAALEEQGYVLCQGDKRDFCVVDQAGDAHSLARRLDGVKAKDVRERMADVDRNALPSAAEASALVKARRDDDGGPVGEDRVIGDDTAPVGGEHPPPEVTPPAPSPESAADTAFDLFAQKVKQVMRDNSGEPQMHDGLSWVERAATIIAATTEPVIAWVKGHWQNLVEQFHRSDTTERDDPGIDR